MDGRESQNRSTMITENGIKTSLKTNKNLVLNPDYVRIL